VNDLLIFLLLFSAVGIGWLLGRRSVSAAANKADSSRDYYQGLNYLLDGRPDGTADSFIDGLEVNSETLETHLSMGNLLRKRGEVDRAIRVHQNLLGRPSLPRSQVHLAHLELARDYISAGLLDRAEGLLLALVDESAEQRVVACRHLLEIYQSEREWQRAIDVAESMLPKKKLLLGSSLSEGQGQGGQQVGVALPHYYCELAEEKILAGEVQIARSLLDKALVWDKQCVRASLMLGEVEYKVGHYPQAIKALRRVKRQDPDYLPETVVLLRQCYQQIDDEKSLKIYLEECFGSDPSPNLLLAVAEDICETGGKESAAEFLSGQLADQPSLRGLAKLINLQLDFTDGPGRDNLGLLQVLVNRLISERPIYRCGHCGFSGRQLHWFCPGCKYWGTLKSIRNGGE
jgi:lipopolysaccharide biosynthesis regulator YciM